MNQDFIKSTLLLRGKDKGQKWLDSLPELVKTYEKKWGLKSKGPFQELSINFIEKAQTKGGEDVVLKIGVPGDEDFLRETKTLEAYNGNGAIRILREDPENSVLLLEACVPGKPLHSLNSEEKEALIFTNISKRVWKKISDDSGFPKLSDESKDFDWYFKNLKKAEKFIPKELVEKAKEKFDSLISAQKDVFLLHGDLHHDNILSSERGWLAIDPKGVMGEREYESASFIVNPRNRFEEDENAKSKEFLANRIELIATALRFDKKKITEWAFVKQVLFLIWMAQDLETKDKIGLEVAEALEQLV